MISEIEKDYFLKLFIDGGYVMDFSTNNFDTFTQKSIGTSLCKKYQLSKGKSLKKYINESTDSEVYVLFKDLLQHYDLAYGPDNAVDFYNQPDKPGKIGLYMLCKEIIEREDKNHPLNDLDKSVLQSVDYISKHYSNEYAKEMIDELVRLRESNSTEAIGKSKELIETCCKTILENYSVEYENLDVGQLVRKTMKVLEISSDTVSGDTNESKTVKQILGSLSGIASGVAQFRNIYGAGHGKADSFKPLPVRHAKLAVGSSITLVEYLWETYEWKHLNDNLNS